MSKHITNKIVDNKSYSLCKKGKYSYSLCIKGEHCKAIYSSLLKTGLLIDVFYNSEENTICFTGEKIDTLENYLHEEVVLTESKCIKMIDTLTQQIKCLEKLKYAFYGHNVSDILIINDDIFININANTLLPIKDNTITFLCPFEKTHFVNPEIKKITNLPSKIHFQSSYYSLATLLIYCLLTNDIQGIQKNDIQENLDAILKPFFYTKIYWFLKHCLKYKILLLI